MFSAFPEAIETEFKEMAFTLEHAQRGCWVFAVYNQASSRKQIIDRLQQQIKLPFYSWQYFEPDNYPIDYLKDLSEQKQQQRAIVSFFNTTEGGDKTIKSLDFNREKFAQFPHSLIFWVTETERGEIARKAGHFWVQRRATFDFSGLLVKDSAPAKVFSLGKWLNKLVHVRNAEEALRQLQFYQKIAGEYEAQQTADLSVAETHSKLGFLQYYLGNYSQAIEQSQRSLKLYQTLLAEPVVATGNNLALLCLQTGELKKAESLLQKLLKQAVKPETTRATVLDNLASVYFALGNYKQAQSLSQQSLAITEAIADKAPTEYAYSLNTLAEIYAAEGNAPQAETYYEKSLATLESSLEKNHPDNAIVLENLAELYYAQGKYAQAEPLFLKSLAIRQQAFGDEHPATAVSFRQIAKLYLAIWFQLLAQECTHLPLEILDARQGLEHKDAIGLPDVFVPLKAIAPPSQWLQLKQQNRTLANEIAEDKSAGHVPVIDLLAKQRLSVVIGDPGSGKSALVNQLSWLLLVGNKQGLPESLQACIPLRFILRRVEIPAGATKGESAWIWKALEKDIFEKLESHNKAGVYSQSVMFALQQQLKATTGLILFDGLDEVPTANEHRSLILQAIQSLINELPDSTRFIVTVRPYAYTDPRWRLENFTAFFLTAFDKAQRAEFINSWYDAASKRLMLKVDELKLRIPDLIERIENNAHLLELAERPLLLTLISTLHASGGSLPEDRAKLYKNSVDLLLYNWKREPFEDDQGQTVRFDGIEIFGCLRTLAYESHEAQRSQQDNKHTADISETAIMAAFKPVLTKLSSADLLRFLQQHTGILIAREQNSFAFPHRSFQEYLAMAYLTYQPEDVLSPVVCSDPLWWREVFLLAVLEQKEKLKSAFDYICGVINCGKNESDEIRYRVYILAALALKELNINGDEPLTNEVRNGLVELIEKPAALSVTERAEAGRVLAAIGDKREGVGLNAQGLPDIKWIKIPKAKVKISDFKVESFYLAQYPVTNAQFNSFLNDPEGYANERWWRGLDKQYDKPAKPNWSEGNHPRENVSWFEAMAFCRWLSERLGFVVLLPNEGQWQQAACSGRRDYKYPWGKDYKTGFANINEHKANNNVGRTTTVGLYPEGNSEQGVADLSGNVWEWCLNPQNKQKTESLGRVVRGGSWFNSQDDVCASFQGSDDPGFRNYFIGFRVCCVSPIMITEGGDTDL